MLQYEHLGILHAKRFFFVDAKHLHSSVEKKIGQGSLMLFKREGLPNLLPILTYRNTTHI
jgi:hypothetical protein